MTTNMKGPHFWGYLLTHVSMSPLGPITGNMVMVSRISIIRLKKVRLLVFVITYINSFNVAIGGAEVNRKAISIDQSESGRCCWIQQCYISTADHHKKWTRFGDGLLDFFIWEDGVNFTSNGTCSCSPSSLRTNLDSQAKGEFIESLSYPGSCFCSDRCLANLASFNWQALTICCLI